jgi:hypothetical protein
MKAIPIVFAILPVETRKRPTIESSGNHAIRRLIADRPSIPKAAKSLLIASYPSAQQPSLCTAGLEGRDVDDSIFCIGPPNRRPGTSNHLDAFDGMQRYVFSVPIHA